MQTPFHGHVTSQPLHILANVQQLHVYMVACVWSPRTCVVPACHAQGTYARLAYVSHSMQLTLLDERLLERPLLGRHLVWWLATLGVVLTASRSFINEEPVAYDPERAMQEVSGRRKGSIQTSTLFFRAGHMPSVKRQLGIGSLLKACLARCVQAHRSVRASAVREPQVVVHTHYLPRHWRGRAHTPEVLTAFNQLFQFKVLVCVRVCLCVRALL